MKNKLFDFVSRSESEDVSSVESELKSLNKYVFECQKI